MHVQWHVQRMRRAEQSVMGNSLKVRVAVVRKNSHDKKKQNPCPEKTGLRCGIEGSVKVLREFMKDLGFSKRYSSTAPDTRTVADKERQRWERERRIHKGGPKKIHYRETKCS